MNDMDEQILKQVDESTLDRIVDFRQQILCMKKY